MVGQVVAHFTETFIVYHGPKFGDVALYGRVKDALPQQLAGVGIIRHRISGETFKFQKSKMADSGHLGYSKMAITSQPVCRSTCYLVLGFSGTANLTAKAAISKKSKIVASGYV